MVRDQYGVVPVVLLLSEVEDAEGAEGEEGLMRLVWGLEAFTGRLDLHLPVTIIWSIYPLLHDVFYGVAHCYSDHLESVFIFSFQAKSTLHPTI